jgi:hypothetical protein
MIYNYPKAHIYFAYLITQGDKGLAITADKDYVYVSKNHLSKYDIEKSWEVENKEYVPHMLINEIFSKEIK